MAKPVLKIDGKVRACTVVGDYVQVAKMSCPHCSLTPFRVQGNGMRIAADDRHYEADAKCLGCNKIVGLLRVATNTLFGLREDEAVLKHGRARVY